MCSLRSRRHPPTHPRPPGQEPGTGPEPPRAEPEAAPRAGKAARGSTAPRTRWSPRACRVVPALPWAAGGLCLPFLGQRLPPRLRAADPCGRGVLPCGGVHGAGCVGWLKAAESDTEPQPQGAVPAAGKAAYMACGSSALGRAERGPKAMHRSLPAVGARPLGSLLSATPLLRAATGAAAAGARGGSRGSLGRSVPWWRLDRPPQRAAESESLPVTLQSFGRTRMNPMRLKRLFLLKPRRRAQVEPGPCAPAIES